MAKTYEALKKAEEEKKRRRETRERESEAITPEEQSSRPIQSDFISSEKELRRVDFEAKRPNPLSSFFRKSLENRQLWGKKHRTTGFSLAQTFEECHRMKYRILESDPSRKNWAILFTGPQEGEGCTTVLFHFGITLASEGERVILIDANLRSPHLHEFFGLKRENGVVELVLGETTLDEAIQNVPDANIGFISAGRPFENPFAVIESPILYTSLEKIRNLGEWILLDSPPVNSFMDSVAMAGKVDQIVMVVRSERTRWEVAMDAKQRLEAGNGKILGVVLNDRRYHIPQWIYRRI